MQAENCLHADEMEIVKQSGGEVAEEESSMGAHRAVDALGMLQQDELQLSANTPNNHLPKWQLLIETCAKTHYPSELLLSHEQIAKQIKRMQKLRDERMLDELLNDDERDDEDLFAAKDRAEDTHNAGSKSRTNRRADDDDVDRDDAREYRNAMRCDDDEELEDDAREMEGVGQDEEGVM